METPIEKIKKLFEPNFVKNYITEKAPAFARENDLSEISIHPIKKNIGEKFYHIVIKFDLKDNAGRSIFCSAHLNENRKNAFLALEYIKNNSTKDDEFLTPSPLFYDQEMNAFFYFGYEGKNLLNNIKDTGQDISEILKKTAKWTLTLHSTPIIGAENFNKENSRIKTIIPGPKKFLEKIENIFPEFLEEVKTAFEKISKKEEEILEKMDKKFLIHGDLHPENVIITKNGKISVIDFTDVCVSDWARDIGNFMQQIGYMSRGYTAEEEIEKNKNIFLEEYLTLSGIQKTPEIMERITLYESWSALRSAIYFLIKGKPEKENAMILLKELKGKL